MKFSRAKPKKHVILGLFFFSFVLAYLLSYSSIFRNLELKLLDLRFQMRGPLPLENSPIVIIAIDDQSDLSTPHRWPWPRSYFAHVIENLERAGAAVIGIDVIFDQPDRYNPANDDSLAHVLARYDNVVLAGKIQQRRGRISTVEVQPPFEKFSSVNRNWGLVTLEADIDGFYRRYPLKIQAHDTAFFSFGIQLIRLYQQKRKGKEPFVSEEDDVFRVGDYLIPRYDHSNMLVNFYGPPFSFTYFSFDNVLDDQEVDLVEDYDIDAFDDPGDSTLGIPPGLLYSGALRDKIVLIGSTMPELHDNFPTPYLKQTTQEGNEAKVEMPGVEIHANALQTILDRNFLQRLGFFWALVINLLLALLVLIAVRRFATLLNLLFVIALIAGYVWLSFFLFGHSQLVVSMVPSVLVVVFTFVSQITYNYILAQQEKKMLRGVFSHYVPEKVIQEIIAHPEKLALGGEERVVTVLFSDVAGFTTLSEQMTPKELVALLNEYLTAMTEIILKHNGIIDKFEGDAIMAEFGVPVAHDLHQKEACLAALEMQHELRRLRYKWKKEKKPQLHMRVGINTGEMIVGNMGSNTVFDYTVIGDHVNLGARLEGANKLYNTQIMVSSFTYEAVKDDFIFRPLDLIRVKGKKKPVQVYELIGTLDTKFTDQFLDMLDRFNQGLVSYRMQQWDLARELFTECLKLVPEDGPSKLYIERCKFFAKNPPPANWDGVWELKEK